PPRPGRPGRRRWPARPSRCRPAPRRGKRTARRGRPPCCPARCPSTLDRGNNVHGATQCRFLWFSVRARSVSEGCSLAYASGSDKSTDGWGPIPNERASMKKEMLINVLQPEEIRIAILEDGVLEELYVERTSHESYVGNIYKGRVVNIEPSIQAAFV